MAAVLSQTSDGFVARVLALLKNAMFPLLGVPVILALLLNVVKSDDERHPVTLIDAVLQVKVPDEFERPEPVSEVK